MATTSRGIVYPVVGDNLTPLANHFANLATTTDTAIGAVDTKFSNDNRQFYGLAADRATITGMKVNDTYQESDGSKLLWIYNGTTWLSQATATPRSGISISINRLAILPNRAVAAHLYIGKSSDFTTGEVVADIPAGFRPFNDWYSPSLHFSGGYAVNANFVQVNAAGEVRINVGAVAGLRYAFVTGTWLTP